MVVNSGSKASQLAICAVTLMAVVAVACGPDVPATPEAPATPEEVLEKALVAMGDQEGYHIEYDYHLVDMLGEGSADDRAVLTMDISIVADFQAPDRMWLRGGGVMSMGPGGNVDNEFDELRVGFDELWVGNVVYVRNPTMGRGRTGTYPDKYPRTFYDAIDIVPDTFSALEFAEPEIVDGHESYKLSGRVMELSGVYAEYLKWDDSIREFRVEYYIGKDDYLIRKFFYETVSDDKAKSVNAAYTYSRFDSPATIDIPEVAPPTPP